MSELFDRLQKGLSGSYQLERELGGGGMSRVFLAQETALGRKVVLKVLPPDLGAGINADRFRREIQLAANLQHPHIVPIFSAGEADGLLYYTMPFIEGESLRQKLSREAELPVPEVIRILREVADALASAHRRGIVHRDIKPDNVLLSEHHALVTDFGVAKALTSATGTTPWPSGAQPLTSVGLALGTPSYMAPEQAAGDAHTDQRADIYALGAMAYEMLTGEPPFTGSTPQQILAGHLSKTPEHITVRRAAVPAGLNAVIMRCLEKRPADRYQNADELLAALETTTTPGGGIPTAVTPAIRRSSTLRLAVALGLIVVAGLVALYYRSRPEVALNKDLLAVAPFDVFDPKLQLWREGLVDVLSRSLDGAGSTRTVPPSVVIQRWSGRADVPSAVRLGHATGAGVVLFGSVVGAGSDSVRVAVSLLDVASGKTLAEIERRDVSDRMDRAADSVTVVLLGRLRGGREPGTVRLARLGSSSVPAMKTFLQGEQYFRRAIFDSARSSYEAAVSLDSNFALALQRVSQAVGWQSGSGDSIAMVRALRAGRLNHGLGPRDSIMLSADSIIAALSGPPSPEDWSLRKRLFERLNGAVQHYPDDAYAWYELGDARYHFGVGPGLWATPQKVLDAFDRSIALDSSFAPAYIHPLQLSLDLKGEAGARHYLDAYLARNPADRALRVARQFVSGSPGERARAVQAVDSLNDLEATSLNLMFFNSADSEEIKVRAGRRALEVERDRAQDVQGIQRRLAFLLAARGHLGEALEVAPPGSPASNPVLVASVAMVGGLPPDSVNVMAHRLLTMGTLSDALVTMYWAQARGDTLLLNAAAQRIESFGRPGHDPADRPFSQYGVASARAYQTLARGDTSRALGLLTTLPDSLCLGCILDELNLARLLEARGRYDDAEQILLRRPNLLDSPIKVLKRLELARVAERLGKKDEAVQNYQYVTAMWRRADPQLEPYLSEAKEALRRLLGEPK